MAGQRQDVPLLLIAAGGTGGHMFPAQALAEEMLKRGWRVTLSTDARGARYTGGFPQEVAIREVASATFARGGWRAKLATPLQIAGGILAALRQMRADRPAVVVGFGGYPSIPALTAAWMLGLPRMIHEQNGVLGRVNRLFAPRVDLVACGIWPTDLPKGLIGQHTGNPVRAAVLEREGAAYIPPGDYPMNLVVFGGSQGARVISDVVPGAVARLPEGIADRRKQGFDVPLDAWFRGPLRSMCEEVLLDPQGPATAYLDANAVRELYEAHQSGRGNHGRQLWALLVLSVWLRRYCDSSKPLETSR